MSENSKISVTVVTGFLGAGKTTLINFILTKYPKINFALVENEFGEVSIDTKLIKGVDASQMFELKKGCICCTITDEYELVLQELAERFPNTEHLLIETTGVADPSSVIRPFLRDDKLKEIYSFCGTICLVDAINFNAGAEKDLKLKQIAIADFNLISKSSGSTTAEIDNIKKQIELINPYCKTQTDDFKVSDKFDLQNLFVQPKFYPDFSKDSAHNLKIFSELLTFSGPLEKERFTYWLSYTLDIYSDKIYRVKGILCFEDEPYEFILQAVGGDFELLESTHLLSSDKSQIVLIGKLNNINLTDIQNSL